MFVYPEHLWGMFIWFISIPFRNTCPPLQSARSANKPSRFPPTQTHLNMSPLQRTHTHAHIHSPNTRPHNLEGDIRNKFNTSAYPRSALRTKRNLILDKPPDRISALALCCWFTAIPSTHTSHTLARFPCSSPPPQHCLYFSLIFSPPLLLFTGLTTFYNSLFHLLAISCTLPSPHSQCFWSIPSTPPCLQAHDPPLPSPNLFQLLPPASISPSPPQLWDILYIYLHFCSSPLSGRFNTIGIKRWHDLLGILKQAGILVRLFECLIFSARRWLKPLKCFGNTYSTVAPMKPIKNLIWMRERETERERERERRKGGGGTQFAFTSSPSAHCDKNKYTHQGVVLTGTLKNTHSRQWCNVYNVFLLLSVIVSFVAL